jgi:hypothetical protein
MPSLLVQETEPGRVGSAKLLTIWDRNTIPRGHKKKRQIPRFCLGFIEFTLKFTHAGWQHSHWRCIYRLLFI